MKGKPQNMLPELLVGGDPDITDTVTNLKIPRRRRRRNTETVTEHKWSLSIHYVITDKHKETWLTACRQKFLF